MKVRDKYLFCLFVLVCSLFAVHRWRALHIYNPSVDQIRHAPGNERYLRDYIYAPTRYGSIGLKPGTLVHLTTQINRDCWTVNDGRHEFTVPAAQLTDDMALGANLRAQNEKTVRAVIEDRRRTEVDKLCDMAIAEASVQRRLEAVRQEAAVTAPKPPFSLSLSLAKPHEQSQLSTIKDH